MIIKTLSRKKPSFFQLYDYMLDGAEDKDFIISRNIINPHNRKKVLDELNKNYKLLPKRKDGNALYHDIISFPHQKNIPIKRQKEILYDIANRYLEKRAENNMSFGVIHEEKDHLHCHLMISSNEKHSDTRHRISKTQLLEIQKELENYKLQEYPELGQNRLYTRERTRDKANRTSQSKDRENQLKHRTKEESRAEIIQEKVAKSLLSSYTIKEFEKNLQKQGFEFYVRGNTAGIIDKSDSTKYRLKRLDLETQYQNLLEFEKSREKEIEKIREIQEREVEDELERE